MTKGKRTLLITGAALVFIVLLLASVRSMYNDLVAADEEVKNKWAQVENQLQRRYDLIPNLIEAVGDYAQSEKRTFLEVEEARKLVGNARDIDKKIRANNELSAALSRLLAVVERYPDLKANQNFLALQDELAGAEARLSIGRKRYNDAARSYNVRIDRFPAFLLARAMGFEKAPFYSVPDTARVAPEDEF